MATKCKKCYDCVPKRGERGLQGTTGPQGPAGSQGPQGVAGLQGVPGINGTNGTDANVDVLGANDIVVTESIVGGVTTFTVGRPKQFFYDDLVQSIVLDQDVNFESLQYFVPVPYASLTFTNTATVTKTYKMHVSYQHKIPLADTNGADFTDMVDCALIKTGGIILYETLSTFDLSAYLFWGPNANNTIGSGTPIHELLDDQGSPVEFRFLNTIVPLQHSFFYSGSLNAGQYVTVNFKCKSGGYLEKAQFMIEEL
jgi:hypothetical protein